MATATRKTHVARLTLSIDGTDYAVRPIASQVPDIRKAFRLRRLDTGAVYDVAHHGDHASCSCGDYLYRRKDADPRGCKHSKALVAVGLFDPIRERTPEPLDPTRRDCPDCEGMGDDPSGRPCRRCHGLGWL